MSKAYLCAVCGTVHSEEDSIRIENAFVCYACVKLGSIYINRRSAARLAFSDEQINTETRTNLLGIVNTVPKIPTVKEMIAYLDKFIIGQDDAKKSLSLAFYMHLVKHETNNTKLPNNNVILIGATGSGKTYMVTKLCEFNDLLLSQADASRWTEGAYIGGKTVDCLIPIFQEDNDKKANRAVVFLDEIDKVVGDYKIAAQGEVLKILEGSVVKAHEVESAKKGSSDLRFKRREVDTSGLLFIAAGAFSKMDDVLKARSKTSAPIGFGAEHIPESDLTITQEDLITYGMMPEFLGRMHRITKLSTLTKNDLIDIMIKTEDSVLLKYKEFFSIHKKSLVVEDSILEEIAERALALKTGARGLSGQLATVLEEKILDLDYTNDTETGVVRVSKEDLKEFKNV